MFLYVKKYWNRDYPLGVVNVDLEDVIDLDEMGLYLENTNRKHGKTVRGDRVDEEGVYNRDVKMNFLAAISGDNNNPMIWAKSWVGEGTTL